MAVGILTARTEEDTDTVFSAVIAVSIGSSEIRTEVVAVAVVCQTVIELLEAVRVTDLAQVVAESV